MRVLLLTLLMITLPLEAAELRTTRAAKQGMSAERLERIDALIERYVEASQLAGVHVQVNRGGRIVHDARAGTMGADDPRPLPEDAIWRIYSMSKPITAVAALMLYEEGAFQLTDPITRFLPEMAELQVHTPEGLVPVTAPPTIQQLMTHTAGFGYVFTDHPSDAAIRDAAVWGGDLDNFVERIAAIPLIDQPGERWSYSVASDLLGALVERASGMPFDAFLRTRIFGPLDMRDTFFSVPEGKRDRLVTNHDYDREAERLIPRRGETEDLGPEGMSFPSGGGGLFSTMRDYMRFAEMLRAGGTLDGVRLLSPKTIEFMASNHLVVPASGSGEAPQLRLGNLYPGGFGFGLGVGVVDSPQALGVLASEGEFSWGGAAGTIFWVDPVEDIALVGMIQLMRSPWPLRSQLRVLTNGALVETAASSR
ncbi:MAG: serine hydrolase domain-containing protein [Pseudomonadales bacterium]|nr:serine hydrolase domain-containing protein [Pseudomonadales bacterium]